MPELPKIAVRRLGAGTGSSSHPDANLLTAFLENSLSARERTAILQHLSACDDCRDIVSLSLPEQSVTVVTAATPVSSRLAWPVLRWAALAACVVVVGAAVMLRHQPHSKSQESIAVQTSNPVSSEAKVVTAPPASAPPPSFEARDQLAYARKSPALLLAPKSKRMPAEPTTPPGVRDELSATNLAEAKSGLARADTEPANAPAESAASGTNLSADEMIPGRAKDASQDTETMRSRAAAAPIAMQKSAAAGLDANTVAASRAMLQVPRWTLTSDGTLQRSLDAGQTWQTVPVAAHPGTFRALSANGLNIWVGGSNGALYHSSDAGQHWRQVQPISNGQLLTSDIIGVQFTDLQHGSVSTAAQETWNTDDAGQTWTKQ